MREMMLIQGVTNQSARQTLQWLMQSLSVMRGAQAQCYRYYREASEREYHFSTNLAWLQCTQTLPY